MLFQTDYNTYFKAGILNKNVVKANFSDFLKIKNTPFLYWISDNFRQKFSIGDLSSVVNIKQGIATSNNSKFCRFWWEILENEGTYYPYAKGGTFNRWSGNLWLRIKWDEKSISDIEKMEDYKISSFILKKELLIQQVEEEDTHLDIYLKTVFLMLVGQAYLRVFNR